ERGPSGSTCRCRRGASPSLRQGSPLAGRVAPVGHARRLLRQHTRAVIVEMEADLDEALLAHGMAEPGLVLGDEHEEPAAAGADQLAAGGAVAAPDIVPVIDLRVGHSAGALSLLLPVLVHEPAEPGYVALLQCRLRPAAEVLCVVQGLDHGAVLAFGPGVLVFQDRRGRAREAGEEEEKVVLEREAGLLVDGEAPGIDGSVLAEGEAGQPAESRDVLVLLADRLAEEVDLDVAGLLGKLARMNDRVAVRVKRAQERGGEAARRAKAGAGRNIGKRGDLDLRPARCELPQRLADDAVAHLVDGVDVLEP